MTFTPGDRAARVEIEDDAARADSHFRQNAFAAVNLPTGKIGVAKVAVLDAKHGNVGDRADSDLPSSGWPISVAGLVVDSRMTSGQGEYPARASYSSRWAG